MQASELGNRNNASCIGRRGCARDRGIFRQSQMCPSLIVIDEIVFQDPAQMPFVEDNHMVKALATEGPYNPFYVTVLPG